MVYVILQGHFITIFSGKLLQHLPDPAPVLHRLLLVPGEFQGDVPFRNLPQRHLPPPPHNLLSGRDRACSAHHPHIQVGHGQVGPMQRSDGLVTVSLLLEPDKIPLEIRSQCRCLQVPRVSPEQLIRPLPRNDPLEPLLPGKAGNEVLGQGNARY